MLATKFGMPMSDSARPRDASRAYIMRAAEASLKRLRTDWIDLYQVHRPDPKTPIEETMRALDDLVQAGQGAPDRLLELFGRRAGRRAGRRRSASRLASFVTCQDEYSLLARGIERELAPGDGASTA